MAATTTRNHGLVLGTVGLAVASAIAVGVFHLMQSVEEDVPQEPDTTAYLLGGANGEALRAAIKRRAGATWPTTRSTHEAQGSP